MPAITLYEISETLIALCDTLELCETDEQRAECEADIQAAVAAEVRKVDDFGHFLAHLESQAELAAEEMERLKRREQVLTNTRRRLEQYAVHVMQSLDLKKLKGDTVTLSLRQNPPAVEIMDEEQVPAKFKTVHQTVTLDRRAIKRAIDSGAEVPGADLRFGTISLVRR